MLTVEQNEELTQVGPGTRMGERAAPLLVPDRLRAGLRPSARQDRAAARRELDALQDRRPAGTGSSASPARTAGRR